MAFKENSDPVKDLGIGLIYEIREFCQSKCLDDFSKEDFLITSAKYGMIEYVKYLLQAGANIHAISDCALRQASFNGHVEVVKILLDAGADIHANNDQALQWAKEEGYKDIVKILVLKEKEHGL